MIVSKIARLCEKKFIINAEDRRATSPKKLSPPACPKG
jgi:hypothetical protein